MPKALDVAQYILEKLNSPVNTIKLQKLVFYSQAWHLVWEDSPIFDEDFEAWANGPVAPSLFKKHQGEYEISAGFDLGGDSSRLLENQKESIDEVLNAYGSKTSSWLVSQTHNEDPWKTARKGYSHGERCNTVITKASIQNYYSGLLDD